MQNAKLQFKIQNLRFKIQIIIFTDIPCDNMILNFKRGYYVT